MVKASFSFAIVGLFTVGVIHIVFTKLTLVNWINKIFIGQPTIVIKHGKLIKANLKRSRFTLTGLLSGIREKGYPDLALIDYALIEPNGDLSVLPKQKAAPITPEQLGIETSYLGFPMAVIIEGEIQHRNLKLIDKDEHWLKKELETAGFQNMNNIFYAAVRDTDYLLTVDTGVGVYNKVNQLTKKNSAE